MGNAAFGLGLFSTPEVLHMVCRPELLGQKTRALMMETRNSLREQMIPGAPSGLSAEELLAATSEGCSREMR